MELSSTASSLGIFVWHLGGPEALWHAEQVCGDDGLVKDGGDGLVKELWRQQSIWSQTAKRMKASIGRTRFAALMLPVGGAVVAVLAVQLPNGQRATSAVLAVTAAVLVGLVPVLQPRHSVRTLRDWTRARSVSETIVSEVYLYLAGAGDYRGGDRDRWLKVRTDRVRQDAADLLRHTVKIKPVQRPLPDVCDYGSYLSMRVDGQVDGYYRPKARQLQTRLRQLRRIEVMLAVIGVMLGALAASFAEWGLSAWIAVVTTISGTVAAHVGAAHYEYQLIAYLRTADELSRLRRHAAATPSPAELDELVVQCERIISIQNEGWMAALSPI